MDADPHGAVHRFNREFCRRCEAAAAQHFILALCRCRCGDSAIRTRSFFEFSLCLSRACLGKIIIYINEWLRKIVFLPGCEHDAVRISGMRQLRCRREPGPLRSVVCRDRPHQRQLTVFISCWSGPCRWPPPHRQLRRSHRPKVTLNQAAVRRLVPCRKSPPLFKTFPVLVPSLALVNGSFLL